MNSERTGFVFNDPNLTDLVVNQITTKEGELSQNQWKKYCLEQISGASQM